MKYISNEDDLKRIVYGSAVLGGGGGGSIDEGLKLGRLALNISTIQLADLNELTSSSTIVTTSTVGSQVKGEDVLKSRNYVESVRLLKYEVRNIERLISSEIGGLNTISPWVQSATLEIPVIDASCDGRVHP